MNYVNLCLADRGYQVAAGSSAAAGAHAAEASGPRRVVGFLPVSVASPCVAPASPFWNVSCLLRRGMPAEPDQKRLYLLLRYVFVAAASYLLLFHSREDLVPAARAVAIALALAANVMLSLLPARLLFAWWVERARLLADTVWAGWTLHAVGGVGEEFFLLLSRRPRPRGRQRERGRGWSSAHARERREPLHELGTVAWTTRALLRAVFLFTVAVFYGQRARPHPERAAARRP
jgi:hypothetical protein